MATVLVTGANRGIGLEFCKQLKTRGDEVIAACRNSNADLDALGVRVETLDVTSDEQVAALAQRLEGTSIDVLINNAGILTSETLDELNFDQIRQQFEVNSLGPLRVTAGLRHLMPQGAKVGIVTSRMGSLTDNTSGSRYGYRMSKAAVNMAGVSLAHDLKDAGVAVAILHPGFVRTDMTGHNGVLDPDESVRGLLARLDEVTLETSGTFWHTNGEVLPW
ncbi:MAG: SDR family oxidoreductase [Deltaproteobacteria bacterium]|nr:MAG: SDR family oxidoreductase [Deltaproteobacteria bacterium]